MKARLARSPPFDPTHKSSCVLQHIFALPQLSSLHFDGGFPSSRIIKHSDDLFIYLAFVSAPRVPLPIGAPRLMSIFIDFPNSRITD